MKPGSHRSSEQPFTPGDPKESHPEKPIEASPMKEQSEERQEKAAERFDEKLTKLLNGLGLGSFIVLPSFENRFDVGVTPDGKLSGRLYNYQVCDETSRQLFLQMRSRSYAPFQYINSDDIIKAIGIVFREDGLKVYKYSGGELIIEGRDETGTHFNETDERGENKVSTKGRSLHTLYCPRVINNRTSLFADGLMVNGRISKQGEGLFHQRENLYDHKIAPPIKELEPFTMTAEEFRDYIQKREGEPK